MDLTEDSVDSRRITRQSRNRGVFAVELRPRSALKRKCSSQLTSVNGSEEQHSVLAKDEGSPDKIQKLQKADNAGDRLENYEEQMDTTETDQTEQEDQNQDMSSEDENGSCEVVFKTKPLTEEKNVNKTLHIMNLVTDEMRTYLQHQKNVQQKPPKRDPPKMTGDQDTVHSSQTLSRVPSRTGSAVFKTLENRQDVLTARSSIREYQEKMEEKAKDASSAELHDSYRYTYVKGHTTRVNQTNNVPAPKHHLQGTGTELKKTVITKANSASASRGYLWGLLKWAVFLLGSLALGIMGYQRLPVSSSSTRTTENLNMLLAFKAHLAVLKPLFPSQRPELWKRTEIHLQKHLNLTNPSEPVSVILTSGRGAEKTLGCLAQHMATAFSNALNSSVLSIDGTSKRAQDSDQVKLDIDRELREAFEGGTQAAVIHRFDELPPGSTLIFYRYCDHENAAYKKVFLAFTVMLPVHEVDPSLSLSEVEEQVQGYLQGKFVSSESPAKFNQMDVDKLSGLWSRISHVILPVAGEPTIEQKGCES